MLNFIKSFSCLYWDDYMVFILQFVAVVFHNGWFVDTEESLHPWDTFYMIMVNDPLYWIRFAILLSWALSCLCSSVILACDFVFFVWYFCLVLVSGWWWPHRMSLGVFLPLKFFGRVSRIGVSSSLFDSVCLWSHPYFIFSTCERSVHIFCFFLI